MVKKFISITTATLMLALGLSVFSAVTANAVSITDNSTVSLVSADSTLAPCSQNGYINISTSTRVRTWTTGDNAYDFSSISTASFVWNSSTQSTYNSVIARSATTRTTFTPVTGTTYTFYRLKEGSTNANYFCHAGQIELLINGTDSITGWVVSPTTFFTAGESVAVAPVTLTAEQIAANAAAAAKAAAQAAAEARAAAISAAQDKLATVLKSDKPGTLSDFRSANINVTTDAAVTRLNAEILKLSAADRSDFAKIKALADKIEFDESFFNATARPTVATYSQYGVTVTDRTVATINAKVLELPVAKRTDVTAIAEIAKVENFVDRVANPATRLSVPATTLVSKGLLPADSPYKYSVVQGLAMYPEGSLNTMAKIEAAIKAEVDKAGARKAKTEAIKAKIAARRG